MKSTFLLVTLAACAPDLEALTAPPPGARADLDTENERITLSVGAALAVACTDGGDLCEHMTVAIDDPLVAGARVAYQNALDWTWVGERPVTSFVIFGKTAGSTRVVVDSAAGTAAYSVRVLD